MNKIELPAKCDNCVHLNNFIDSNGFPINKYESSGNLCNNCEGYEGSPIEVELLHTCNNYSEK